MYLTTRSFCTTARLLLTVFRTYSLSPLAAIADGERPSPGSSCRANCLAITGAVSPGAVADGRAAVGWGAVGCAACGAGAVAWAAATWVGVVAGAGKEVVSPPMSAGDEQATTDIRM